MRLIDVTNSYPHLVAQQLANTDTNYIKVYSLGSTTVVYTRSATHDELLFTSETRNVQPKEVAFTLDRLCKLTPDAVDIIYGDRLAEVSFPHKAN